MRRLHAFDPEPGEAIAGRTAARRRDGAD